MSRRHLANAAARAAMIHTLLTTRSTYSDLQEESGMAHETISRIVRSLRHAKCVYISGWAEDDMGRKVIPMFSMGIGRRDAPKPPPLTKRELNARQRERKRSPEMVQREKLKQIGQALYGVNAL